MRKVVHLLDKNTGQVAPDIDIEATAMVFLGQVQATAFLWSLSGFEFSISERAPALWRAFAESLEWLFLPDKVSLRF